MAALPHSSLVPVEEYLNTSYEPDLEYVDGVLVERNMGDWLHALIQSNVLFALRRRYPHLKVVAELRSRVTETRYRLPDVSVLLAAPTTKYLLDAAFLVVEVLSEGDVMSAVIEKLKEYARKGIPNIWLIDPRLQLIAVYRPATLIEIDKDVVATEDGSVELARSEIFAA
ncbi:MAG: Uma2 family endonuclease [Acidobacteriia bacterium]|nr:Uma2 family endonuclease [Terriglobia bacterium]